MPSAAGAASSKQEGFLFDSYELCDASLTNLVSGTENCLNLTEACTALD
jgi:hypothetical protein